MPAAIADPHSIAVIIPLYNGGLYLPLAIASVFGQSLTPGEVVVVDDGSTDDSYAVAQELQAHFPFKLLQKANGGQSSARNHGVANCASAFVAFLDQDDIWYPHHLTTLLKPFLADDAGTLGWAYANMDVIDQRGDFLHRRYLDRLPQIEHPKTSVIDCLRHDMHILPSASLVRRAAHEAIGGFDNRLAGYEDDDYFLRLFAAGYLSSFIDEPVYRWRHHAASMTFTLRMARSRMIYARKLFERYPDDPDRSEYPSRDIIAPRFFPEMLRVFFRESHAGRFDNAAWALAECGFLAQYLPRRYMRRVRQTLPVLLWPPVQKASANRYFAAYIRWWMGRMAGRAYRN